MVLAYLQQTCLSNLIDSDTSILIRILSLRLRLNGPVVHEGVQLCTH